MAGRAGFSGLVPYLFPSVRSRLAHACHDSTATSVNAVNAVYQRASFSALPANSTALIKELREKSGAPISDVKACLQSHGWDISAAYDALRKKGLAAAAKKASKHAAEGLVGVAKADGVAAIIEINSETDFVARSELFQRLVSSAATAVARQMREAIAAQDAVAGLEMDVQQVGSVQLPEFGCSISDACMAVAAQVRENIRLRRGYLMTATQHTGEQQMQVVLLAAWQ
eukprot:jgi/Chrzof1/12502/Cz06g36180.t1